MLPRSAVEICVDWRRSCPIYGAGAQCGAEANPGLSLAYCQMQMIFLDGEKLGTPEEWLSEIDPLRWKSDFINDGIDVARCW